MPAIDRDDIGRELGLRIARRARKIGITQRELCRRAGFSESHGCKIIQGRQRVSVQQLLRIARALETTGSELIVGLQFRLDSNDAAEVRSGIPS